MKIAQILQENCIQPELRSGDKSQVITELSELISSVYQEIDAQELKAVLAEREHLGSTGIGHGVAILHGKLPTLQHIISGFGRSQQGIPFESQDEKPVNLFFVLIAPKNSASLHLKAMARLSRLLKDAHFRNRLIEAEDAHSIFEIIISEDEKF